MRRGITLLFGGLQVPLFVVEIKAVPMARMVTHRLIVNLVTPMRRDPAGMSTLTIGAARKEVAKRPMQIGARLVRHVREILHHPAAQTSLLRRVNTLPFVPSLE
jgi:hypothetical protein